MKKAMLMMVAMATTGVATAKNVTVDFDREVGKMRPELHSSSFANMITEKGVPNKRIAGMNFHAVRTHDMALINAGSRVVDNHFIFPLEHLDAKDPANYYFEQTDYLLELQRKMGFEIFYRLGTSIEHSGSVHFNASIPKDFEKVAENFAATVRHYNRGWANGKEWGIKYWEIWNEPDGHNNMWSVTGKDDFDKDWEIERRDLFAKFFVTVLKRLKSEFPDIKVGGPALCSFKDAYLRKLLTDCKAADVKPDFISWHYYGRDPDEIIALTGRAKKICAEFGFEDVEMIINEWHFLPKGQWKALQSRDLKVSLPANLGPGSIVGIDSACFTLATLAKLQRSDYAQAYFYGCRHYGSWGYRDSYGRPNPICHALTAFGSLVKDTNAICETTSGDKSVTALSVKTADGKKALLVVDYLGSREDITVEVKGCTGKPTAKILSSGTDGFEPCEVTKKGGKYVLVKPDAWSVAYLVTFE